MSEFSFESFKHQQEEEQLNFDRILNEEQNAERPRPHSELKHSVVIPTQGEIISGNLQSAVESIFSPNIERQTIEVWCVINAVTSEQKYENEHALEYVHETNKLGYPVFGIDCEKNSLNIGMVKDLGAQVALSRLHEVPKSHQSIVFLDADSQIADNYFEAVSLHIESGANLIIPLQIFVPDKNFQDDQLTGFYKFMLNKLKTRTVTFFETRDLSVEYPGIAAEAQYLESAGGVEHVEFGELELLYLDNIDKRKDIVFSPFAEVIIKESLKRGWHSGELAKFLSTTDETKTPTPEPKDEIQTLEDVQTLPYERITDGLLQFLDGKIVQEEILRIRVLADKEEKRYLQLLTKKQAISKYASCYGRLLGFLKALYAADNDNTEFDGLTKLIEETRLEYQSRTPGRCMGIHF